MADVDTDLRRLQVANLPPADSGRGVARLPLKLMTELGLAEGDVIEIVGKRSTAARARNSQPSDSASASTGWPPQRARSRAVAACTASVIRRGL